MYTKPEIDAMSDEEITRAHMIAKKAEKKIRRAMQERRKANTPPGFIPTSTPTPKEAS